MSSTPRDTDSDTITKSDTYTASDTVAPLVFKIHGMDCAEEVAILKRAFAPHVTLGRTKNRAGGDLVRRLVETLESPSPMTMHVDSLTMFESRLTPGGARYESILTAPLASVD